MTDYTANFGAVEISNTLRHLTSHYANILRQIGEDEFSAKQTAGTWSKKEILGHLIDSAQNNLRRFVSAQYELQPPHIVYDQDFWVAANSYQQAPTQELIVLWKLLNDRIASVLENMPPAKLDSLCNTGKVNNDLHPLSFLATDYISHTRHHLKQVAGQDITS